MFHLRQVKKWRRLELKQHCLKILQLSGCIDLLRKIFRKNEYITCDFFFSFPFTPSLRCNFSEVLEVVVQLSKVFGSRCCMEVHG